ncbi:unnamed protein product, partial [Prorocentrum cordatum]
PGGAEGPPAGAPGGGGEPPGREPGGGAGAGDDDSELEIICVSEGPGVVAAGGRDADGGWQRAAAAAAAAERASPEPEEPLWTPDGAGNLTHWCAESRRLFLWQEATGVLYRQEPAGDRAARAALPPPRREA